MTYGPGARKVQHTRAAIFVWAVSNGRYLCWFHNHGGTTYHNQRNPAWIMAGREVDTSSGREIAWSEPEILFYDQSPEVRMSYPDFVEDDGRYFVTETQKTIARVHEVPADFLNLRDIRRRALGHPGAGLRRDFLLILGGLVFRRHGHRDWADC